MKNIALYLIIIFSLPNILVAQSFKAEREKDITKFSKQMEKLENAYWSSNLRDINRGVKNLTKIMAREIERSKEDVAQLKQEYYSTNATNNEIKFELQKRLNRLEIMMYIFNRANTFDINQLDIRNKRQLAGYRNGLNHFNTLMSYNVNPELTINRIPENATWKRTPLKKEKEKTNE